MHANTRKRAYVLSRVRAIKARDVAARLRARPRCKLQQQQQHRPSKLPFCPEYFSIFRRCAVTLCSGAIDERARSLYPSPIADRYVIFNVAPYECRGQWPHSADIRRQSRAALEQRSVLDSLNISGYTAIAFNRYSTVVIAERGRSKHEMSPWPIFES